METEFYIVKPADGFTIRDPNTFMVIPEAGARVRADGYWDRMLKEGAVTITPEGKPEEPKPVDPEVNPDDAPKTPRKPEVKR